MSITKKVFYTEPLSCNCPQCFGTTSLEIRFSQEWKENAFSKKATPIVREELFCNLCEEVIYPVKWSDDIERLYEYHKKRAQPSVFSKKKPLFWIVLVGILLVIGAVIFFLVNPNLF